MDADKSPLRDLQPLPPFYRNHPPLWDGDDVDFPPSRSAFQIIGTAKITGKDRDRVDDPDYPWQKYLKDNSAVGLQKIKQIKAARDTAVDHYLVTRRKFWEMAIPAKHPAVDETVTVTKHTGFTGHQSAIEHESTVTRIAFELGINLTAPSGVEVPPVPPMADAANTIEAGDGGGGGGPGLDMKFSSEFTHQLEITHTDEKTYTKETTETITMTFKGGHTYLFWQRAEEVVLERVSKQNERSHVKDPITAYDGTDYTDEYPKSDGSDPDDNMH